MTEAGSRLTIRAILLPGLQSRILGQAGVFRDIEVFQRFRRSRQKRILHGGKSLAPVREGMEENRGDVEESWEGT